jgi:hypothetical protein
MYHILNNGNYEGQDGHYQLYYSESDWTYLEYRKYHSVRSTEKYIFTTLAEILFLTI